MLPAPDSYQTLGYYLELCEWYGFRGCCDTLKRRISASPDGEKTRAKTPHHAMLEALVNAHIKDLIARGEARFVQAEPEEPGYPEEPEDWEGYDPEDQ